MSWGFLFDLLIAKALSQVTCQEQRVTSDAPLSIVLLSLVSKAKTKQILVVIGDIHCHNGCHCEPLSLNSAANSPSVSAHTLH